MTRCTARLAAAFLSSSALRRASALFFRHLGQSPVLRYRSKNEKLAPHSVHVAIDTLRLWLSTVVPLAVAVKDGLRS